MMVASLLLILLSFLLDGCSLPSHSLPRSKAVFDHDFPDPFVLRVDGVYYAYATNAGPRNIQVIRSRDRINWERVGVNGDALPELPPWARKTGGLTWAPGVLRRGNEFILYYATHYLLREIQCVSYAVSKRPDGPFVDRSPRPLICPLIRGDSIDPEPFMDRQGTPYLLWKSGDDCAETCSWIDIQQLAPDGKGLVGKPRRLIIRDQRWEDPLVENPSMVFHDGKYYLIYSANRWESAEYGVGYAVCDTPVGPCIKPAERPVLSTAGEEMGPGGASFFMDRNGDLLLAYHAWRKPNVGYASGGRRSLHLGRVVFSNGKPAIGRLDNQL